MPTVGWILEDALERFWEGQPGPDLANMPRPMVVCKWCQRTCSSPADLQSHCRREHPLALPALYVHGEPLLRENVLRTPIRPDDVELVHCTYCDVQRDGGGWHRLSVSAFPAQFAQPTNATWHVRLVHERSEDASRSQEEYQIRFRIPDTATLNALDAHFMQTLVRDTLSHADLHRFEAGLLAAAPAREYGGALGDYALGILLKERHHIPRSQVGFDEFAVKMRSALEVLRLFHSPVALAVASSIRFNLNDFHDYGIATATELETGVQFFRSLSSRLTDGASPQPAAVATPPHASTRAVCPVDEVTHRLLGACVTLASGGHMSLAELEALRQQARPMGPVSEQDLAKIHVICAHGYRHLARTAEAREHLLSIQFHPLFRDWAQRHLEDMSPHGH